MRVQRVLETCLYVDNLDVAEIFYTTVLGLTLDSKVPGRHVFFRCGDAMFLLFNPCTTSQPGGDIPPHGTLGSGHVAFANWYRCRYSRRPSRNRSAPTSVSRLRMTIGAFL